MSLPPSLYGWSLSFDDMNDFSRFLAVSPIRALSIVEVKVAGKTYCVNHEGEVRQCQNRFKTLLRQCFGDRAAERREMQIWTLLNIAKFAAYRPHASACPFIPAQPSVPATPAITQDELPRPLLPAHSSTQKPEARRPQVPVLPGIVTLSDTVPTPSTDDNLAWGELLNAAKDLSTRAKVSQTQALDLMARVECCGEMASFLASRWTHSIGVSHIETLLDDVEGKIENARELFAELVTAVRGALALSTSIASCNRTHSDIYTRELHALRIAEIKLPDLLGKIQGEVLESEAIVAELESLVYQFSRLGEIWETTI